MNRNTIREVVRAILWSIRNPEMALTVFIVGIVGMGLSDGMGFTLSLIQVETGNTATDHQIAEGYRCK